jgi:hypothetical protein
LNRQLAEEREINGRLARKFNEYEAAQIEALSGRDAEISSLREDNRGIKGQRTILLGLVIALVLAWVIYIAYKVCRFFKIIPSL